MLVSVYKAGISYWDRGSMDCLVREVLVFIGIVVCNVGEGVNQAEW